MTAPDRSARPRTGSPSARRPPRTGPRWALRLASAAALAVLGLGGVGHVILAGIDRGIGRIDPFDGLNDRPRGASGLNFLLVGTDRRDTVTSTERAKYRLGGTACDCTDTIMLVHLSADRERASVISLPRDSYAEVPAHTDPATGRHHPARREKLNAAYADGGPQLTVRTVEHMTGIPVHHYLEVDFNSFIRTVDALGGVEICTTRPMKDDYTGLDLPVGRTTLDGGQALQYVRSRHTDGAADLGRMQRQQRFLAALIRKVTSNGVLMNPVRFNQVSSALLESVRADRGFGTDELVALGRAMRDFTPASSEFTSVPVANPAYAVPGLGSTVKWDEPKAARLFAAVRADRPLAVHRPHRSPPVLVDVPPQQVRVHVDNGTQRTGLAGRVDRGLRAIGFLTTGSPGNAPAAEHTTVGYDPRWDRSARTVAAALPGARLRPEPGRGAVMKVTLGADFRQVRPVRGQTSVPDGATAVPAVTGDQVSCH